MNLLYVQAVSDIDRGWVQADKDQHKRLAALQQKNSKKEVRGELLDLSVNALEFAVRWWSTGAEQQW